MRMANCGPCLDGIYPELSNRLSGEYSSLGATAYSSESSNRFEWQFRHTMTAALTSSCWLDEAWEILIGPAKCQ